CTVSRRLTRLSFQGSSSERAREPGTRAHGRAHNMPDDERATAGPQPSTPRADTLCGERDDGDAAANTSISPARTQTIETPADHPQQVGHFRIIAVIGEGGMGTVYKAERRHPFRQTVALKLIKLGMSTREVIARFE